MTPNQYKTVYEFERSLGVGSPVLVRWTNCGHYYSGQAVVTKINRKSFRVSLTEKVPCHYGEPYPVGRTINVPNIDAIELWSGNNRVEPPTGYAEVA